MKAPPDLDELFRRLNRRLSELFGHRGRGSGAPSPGTKFFGGGLGLAAVVLVVIWLGWAFYTVKRGSAASCCASVVSGDHGTRAALAFALADRNRGKSGYLQRADH